MFSDKWHKRFMEVARLVATWSKDPSTKTGAIVVGPDREIRATGYNGLVRGVDDNKPERMERPTKYDFFEHAERNAIYNACLTGTSLKGCIMYATHPPCTDCARAIIQSGIKVVVTNEMEINSATPTNTWRDKLSYSKQMFDEAGIEYIVLPLN
ncbi:MAG: dCMP deaminase family protein [Alphaproteobacteria bacterium]|nr:dCMP deaminase family protein [Alphaproteobacteria bacterium]MBQ8630193.1 dCMP deaminase family protein [Alphaproteobacteria bacterium]